MDSERAKERRGPAGPVMLALSTFRKSGKAVDLAIERARETKRLLIVYVADVNLARYLIGSGAAIVEGLAERCEEELLKQHEQQGYDHLEPIVARAKEEGLEVEQFVRVGRFGLIVLDFARTRKPSLIVTTRSDRPNWVRRFFGSPVDYVKERAGVPVLEA